MVTISVISILILIFSVTVILGFLWYTRNLLNRKCGCSNLHEPLSTKIYNTNQFGLAGSPRRNLVPSINPSIVEQR